MKPIFLVILFASCTAFASDELTEQEFVDQLNDGKRSIDYSNSLVGHKNIHTLIKERAEQKEVEPTEPAATPTPVPTESLVPASLPDADKSLISKNDKPKTTVNSPKPIKKPKGQVKSSAADKKSVSGTSSGGSKASSPAIDPLLSASSNSGITNSMVVDRPNQRAVVYGITIGSQFEVKLQNGANNTYDGYVSFELVSSVEGYIQPLPAGTLLFGKASTVVGDSRLYCRIVKGITPDKEEFSMTGTIIGYDKNPGLVATVSNDGRSLERASSSAVFAMIEGATEAIPGQSIPLEAGRRGTQALANEKQNESAASNGKPAYIVSAPVQKAFVTVTETF